MRNMKKIYNFFLILTAAAMCLIFTSCSKKPEEVIAEYEKAFNTHDTNKLTSLFSSDAEIELSGLNKLSGLKQIRDYAEYDSVLHSNIKISDITSSDGKSFFVVALTNDIFKTIGIDTVKYSKIFKISGGKINSISESATPASDDKIKQFKDQFMLWAAKEKLDVLNEIMPEGRMIYNTANAKKYSELVLEWKKSEQTNISVAKNKNAHW